MRAEKTSHRHLLRSFALVVAAGLVTLPACNKKNSDTPQWQQAPKAYDVRADALTFGKKSLEAFNKMDSDARAAHIEQLKSKPGSFKGQGRFQSMAKLRESIPDHEFGQYEASVFVDDPVLYEITIEYVLLSDEKIGDGYPKGAYVEFSGTVLEVTYHDESKPRSLIVKLKDTTLARLDA